MTTEANRASLCISSEVVSAQQITATLKLAPSEFKKKGSPLNRRKPEGKRRSLSSWILDSDLEEAGSLDAHVDYLVAIVESKYLAFERLSKNCKIELYCGFFLLDEDSQGVGFSLSASLLKRLTIIPMDITVILYPPSSN